MLSFHSQFRGSALHNNRDERCEQTVVTPQGYKSKNLFIFIYIELNQKSR